MVVFAETLIADRAARSLRRAPTSGDRCACGCGDLLSAKVRAARYLYAEGFGYAQIGREIGTSPRYVRTIIKGSSTQGPPRFLPGHSARLAEWRTETCAWCERPFRTSAHEKQPTLRRFCLAPECRQIDWIFSMSADDALAISLLRSQEPQSYTRPTTARLKLFGVLELDEHEQRLAAREEVKKNREARLEDAWIRRATREQAKEMEKRAKAQRAAQRALDLQERAADRSLLYEAMPLDAPVSGDNAAFTWGDVLADTSGEPLAELDRQRFWEIVGDITPDDVARMDEWTLHRLREHLASEGLVHISITEKERERLRAPVRHTGITAPISKRGWRKSPLGRGL